MLKKIVVLTGLLGLLIAVLHPFPAKQMKPGQNPVHEQAQGQEQGEQEPQGQAPVIKQINTKRKIIALTFDDGPDPRFTPRLLQVLKKHGVRATFFLLGQHVERYPAITAQIVQEGHEAGLHGYDHKFLDRLPADQVESQIEKTFAAVYKTTGQKPIFFRPPYGFYNQKVLTAANNLGLQIILWTPEANPRDFENPGVSIIVNRVIAKARPGAIILLHDHGISRRQTIQATDKLITELEAHGYRFDTVGHLLKE